MRCICQIRGLPVEVDDDAAAHLALEDLSAEGEHLAERHHLGQGVKFVQGRFAREPRPRRAPPLGDAAHAHTNWTSLRARVMGFGYFTCSAV